MNNKISNLLTGCKYKPFGYERDVAVNWLDFIQFVILFQHGYRDVILLYELGNSCTLIRLLVAGKFCMKTTKLTRIFECRDAFISRTCICKNLVNYVIWTTFASDQLCVEFVSGACFESMSETNFLSEKEKRFHFAGTQKESDYFSYVRFSFYWLCERDE